MDLITLLRKAINSPEYSEGLKDAVAFLDKDGQGIRMLREIVESLNKEDENGRSKQV